MSLRPGSVALVTGASSGIGAAISEKLVNHGVTVIGCARSTDNLKKVADKLKDAKGKFIPKTCDLKQEAQILQLFREIEADHGGVDIMINNAGLNRQNTLLDGSTQAWTEMFQVNVLGLSICTREAVQGMFRRGINDGHIVHIGSILGHTIFGDAISHFYSGTKYAVKALTEGLRQELRARKSNIRVTCMSPGATITMAWGLGLVDTAEAAEKIVRDFVSVEPLRAEDVADQVMYVLNAPRHVQVHDLVCHALNEPF